MMKKFLLLALAVLTAAAYAQAPGRGLLNRGRRNLPPTRPGGAPAPAAPAVAPTAGGTSDLNFNQTPIDLVFETYGRMVNKTILKDPQTPAATITLKSEPGQKLTDAEQIEAIEIVLEMNGIHLEPYGEKFVRAIPRKEARKEGIPIITDSEATLGESTKVISLMLPFKNISVEDAQKALDNFKSGSGIIIGFERTNTLLLTDTEVNINRMREIARTIDIATPVLENVFVRQIKNASAEEIKTVLAEIVAESQKELEKNGKAPANTAQQARPSFQPGRLLGRPGQNQPAAPVNNQSLVMGISDADRGMIRGKVVILADERSNKLIIVTSKSNMDFFDRVIEQLDVETTPDTVVKVYRLKYAEAEDVSDMINDLIGNASSGKSTSKGNSNANAKKGGGGNMTTGSSAARKPSNQRTGDAKAGELTKDNTTVLADKRINGLVVMTEKELVPTIEQIIESMDIKLSQVLIETVIIEVGLGNGIETGVDWVQLGNKQATQETDKFGNPRYQVWSSPTTDDDGNTVAGKAVGSMTQAEFDATYGSDSGFTLTDIPAIGSYVRQGFWSDAGNSTQYALGGGGGTAAGTLFDFASGVATNLNPTGSGVNWFLKSDKLNLGAVIKASQTDSRTKYIASPIIMTLDNKEAQIEATEMRYMFKGYQYSGSTYNGSAVPDYEQKELGITLKMTPKINPNGTIMLTLEEEYSQEGAGQGITAADGKSTINAATTITRKMSADALLENGQTVIFGGLTQTVTTEKSGGVPFLKDLPYVGKWLFGYVDEDESRSELLVFMTPYVLDDANAAQAEAIRRKKAISDARPWDDHGWSASKLADPVSKKEQMRRLTDEWKKQDEERKTKLAIEKAKVDRAKKLKELSVEERNLWLKMHKEELEKEQKEELEEKLLDKDSQEELKKLAEKVRNEKLGDAEKELKKMEEMTHAENERGKMDAEKARAAEAAAAPEAPAAPTPAAATAEKPAEKPAEEPAEKAP